MSMDDAELADRVWALFTAAHEIHEQREKQGFNREFDWMDWIIRSLAAEGISVVEEDVTAALGRNYSKLARLARAAPAHDERGEGA